MTHRCTPLTWGEQATCAYQPRLEDGVVSQVFLQRLAWLQTHSYEQHKTRADDERDHGVLRFRCGTRRYQCTRRYSHHRSV
jgi:hypothetical protein